MLFHTQNHHLNKYKNLKTNACCVIIHSGSAKSYLDYKITIADFDNTQENHW